MLLYAATRSRSFALLDFLAPSLISRAQYSSTPSRYKSHPVSTQPDATSAIFDKLKKQITFTHSQGYGVSDTQANIFNVTLAQIRKALGDNDAYAVKRHWEHLEHNSLLHFLGPSQLEMISSLLTKTFLPRNGDPWDPSTRKLVEDVALLAAAGRSTDALNACMIHHIKRDDSEAVIELYQRFMGLVGEKELESLNTEKGEHSNFSNSALAVDGKSNTRQIHQSPGRISILLAVTTAYAMTESFGAALQTCLNTVVRFHNFTTRKFLKHLEHNQILQQRVEMYVKRLDLAKMVSRPPSLSRQITNLSTAPTIKPLEALYQAVVNGLSGSDAYLAPDPSAITATREVALTEVGWTSFLVAFLKCRRRDIASKIWDDMAVFGVKPGVSMWTALIDAYDSIRAVDEALATWHMMLAQGVKPDGLTYRALISALFNGRRPEEALKTFRAFQTELQSNCPTVHLTSIYNTVLHGLLYVDRVQDATTLLQNMHDKGPTPDVVSYNTLLAYHGRRGDFKALAATVQKMSSIHLVGDVFSFSTILSALLKAGREDAPDLVLNIMQKQGVEPNVATFSAIIDHQIREQDEKNLRAAARMLHRMEQDPNIHPNEVTYTSILAGLYRGQWLSSDKAEEWRTDIVERMKKYDVKFSRPTYHILIKACLEYPHPVGLQNALEYYRDMVKQRITLGQTTWYILFAGLLQRGEWAIANEMVNDMYMAGVKPAPGSAVSELVSRIKKQTAVH